MTEVTGASIIMFNISLPSGPSQARSIMHYFQRARGLCCGCLSLPSGSRNNQVRMGFSGCSVGELEELGRFLGEI